MLSPKSDSTDVAEDENEEEKIYRLIYDMNTIYDKEEKEKVLTPPSSRPTLVHLKTNAEGDDSEDKTTNNTTQAQIQKDQEGDNTKEPDMAALDNIQGKSVQKVNVKEKPWRKPGADISDYFNYGFDEESWTTYCRKQSQLRTANRKLYNKIMVQMERTIHEEKASSSACPSSGTSSILASRQSSSAIDMTEERPGPSGRMERRSSLSAEGGNSSQVVTEMSPEEDRIASYHLSSQSKVIPLLEVTVAPSFLSRRPPRSPRATLDSRQSKGFDDPLTSPCPCPSGVPSLIPRSASSRAGVINTAKGWECYIWQERRERKYRDRTRERDRDKDRKRGRDTDKESCSLSSSSREECMRDKDTTERRHKHHGLERFRGEKEERHTERRHSDKREARQKSSSSSSSRRDGGEDRDSQSKRKHKKAKRSRKDK